ncbi:MAG TPA: hypothetical protein VF813_11845, partial [Anaerolineaceae bacterium]
TQYYSEILRNEGLNEFLMADIGTVTSQTLTAYDVVILGEMPLTSAQASMFTNWVKSGGNLIAMRPDKQLAGLLGLTDKSMTLSDAYLLVNTTSGPGVGIVNQTIQYHGTADVYIPNGASRVADLYSSLTAQAAGNPVAVSINNVGTKGGQAAAFTYDLAKSIVYTHQGNPAQVLQHLNPWQSQYIVTDLFYPNWTDFNRIAIPQADEQQRLLANLILQMNSSHKPLPRLWYFPRGSKAVVILTGDDHNNLNGGFYSGSTQAFFDYQIAHSPSGCSVSDWTCVRSSSYLFAGNPLTNEQAAKYTAMGFEIGIHSDSALGTPAWCADWSPTSLVSIFQSQLAAFTSQFWSLSGQASIRSHCYAWYGYVDEPKAELSHGIRLDTDIAYWPGDFVQVPAGFMGGSALPMRYADVNGAMVDVYASPTLVTDDDGPTAQPLPNTINTFLDGALGSQGYYGAFTVNIHSDYIYTWSSAGESQVIASAQSRGVPVISGQQMVDWLDGRNASTFQSITWNGSVLGFNLSVGTGARGLQVMIPTVQPFGPVSQVTKNNVAVPFWTQTVKGISYVVFNGDSAHFNVTYTNSSAGPVISNVQTSVTSGNQAAVSFTTSVPASTRVDYGTSPTSLSSSLSDSLFTTSHTFNLTGLTPLTHYYYRVTAVDAGGHTSTYPAATSAPLTFLTPVLDT